jgi:hypothetical protein
MFYFLKVTDYKKETRRLVRIRRVSIRISYNKQLLLGNLDLFLLVLGGYFHQINTR